MADRPFTTSFNQSPASDDPGLVLGDDNVVYLIKPDGTRVAVDGGGALPSQWTVGAQGDVIFATDDPTKFPVTVKVDSVNGVGGFQVVDENGNQLWDISSDGSFFVIGPSPPPVTGDIFSATTSGTTINSPDDSSDALTVVGFSGGTPSDSNLLRMLDFFGVGNTPVFVIGSGGEHDIKPGTSGLYGLSLKGPHAAAANGDLNAGQLTFWFDQSDGAAKLMLKGKSANGTVVTGEVALT